MGLHLFGKPFNYSAEKTFVELSDDISEADRKTLEFAIKSTRDYLDSEASSWWQLAIDMLFELARKVA